MPYCVECGQEISVEEYELLEQKCIDCVHGASTEEGFKLITAICMSFFGVTFFISSFILLLQFIFNNSLKPFLNLSLILPFGLFFLFSILLISFAIKKFRSPLSLSNKEG